LEVFSKDLQDFVPFKGPSEENDTAVPPFERLDSPTILNLTLFLDTKRPLSEPGWCKSGNVEEWLSRELGRSTIPESWKNKITVVDPDEVRFELSVIIKF
jgi:20S proteasome subunit alpha 6